jgi:hypothetical protein
MRGTDWTCNRLHHRTDPPGAFQLSFAFVALRQWVRLGVFYGSAPGSFMMNKHFAAGRDRAYGRDGFTVRTGWWPRPCLTILVHTQWEGNSLGICDSWAQATWEDAMRQEKHDG